MQYKKLLLLLLMLPISAAIYSQHLLSDTISTKYYPATSEPESNWNSLGFNDSEWDAVEGIHTFGYGGAVSVETPDVQSIYIRSFFTVGNKEDINELLFHCDFDDGFVAYINGIEFARVNMGKFNTETRFDQRPDRSHELIPQTGSFKLTGYYIDDSFIQENIIEGENVLSFEVHNDSINGSDLGMFGVLINISNIDYQFHSHKYKSCIQLDSTKLPIIQIETGEFGIPSLKEEGKWVEVPGTIGITNNEDNHFNKPNDAFNDHFGNISIRYRGQSSASFAKHSYNIELLDEEEQDTSVSLLNMPRESDWILQGPFADKSQIRNALFYELARKTGNWTPRVEFCELIINGEFVGLYNLIEKIKRDSNRVNIAKLRPEEISGTDLTGGYIFKFDKGSPQIQIVYPKESNLQQEQKDYIKDFHAEYEAILRTNDGLDEELGYKKYIQEQSLIDYISVVELGKNCDSYLYSSYMHKDKDDRDPRIVYGPIWDFDLCMGNSIWQEGDQTYGWQFEYNRKFQITRLFQDPELVDSFEDRWFEFRESFFHIDSLHNRIDYLSTVLEDPIKRNYKVWPIMEKGIFFPAYDVYSHEEEITYIKNWLQARVDWIDTNIGNIHYDVTQFTDIDDLQADFTNDFSAKVYPNPIVNEFVVDLNMTAPGSITIEMINTQGKVTNIIQESALSGGNYKVYYNQGSHAIDAGMYIINIIIDGKSVEHIKVLVNN